MTPDTRDPAGPEAIDAGRRPPLSIVIATRDRPEMLRRCLVTVVAARGPDDELVVVDSASRDAADVRAVAEEVGARLVRCDRPGETVARNAGWRAATHALVVYVDDDVWVDEGWADGFARAFVAHPEAVFITGRIEVPPHQIGTDRPASIKDDPDPHVIDRATTGVLGHAASLGIRTEVVAGFGGFDELLGAGCRFPGAPELDLFDRLLAAGRTGWYAPEALAWHDQWRSRNELVRLDYRYGLGGGARLSKLVRHDRPRARAVAVDTLWRTGVREVLTDLRAGWQYGAMMRAAATVGVLRGLVEGMTVLTVDDGHLRPRRGFGRRRHPS